MGGATATAAIMREMCHRLWCSTTVAKAKKIRRYQHRTPKANTQDYSQTSSKRRGTEHCLGGCHLCFVRASAGRWRLGAPSTFVLRHKNCATVTWGVRLTAVCNSNSNCSP